MPQVTGLNNLLLKFAKENGNQYRLWKQNVLMTVYIMKIKYYLNGINNIIEQPYFTEIKYSYLIFKNMMKL